MGERGACAIQGFGCKTAEGRRAYWRVQRGLTLVELMIAATLMTMLIAGAIQLYAITRKVDVLAFQVSELYDNALYTFRELQSVVGRAGYRESVTYGSDFASTFLADDTHLFATGQVLGGTENAVNGDTVRFRFTGASTNNIRDCRGEVVRPNQVAIVELFLVDKTLTCSNTVVSKPNPTLVVSGRQEVSLLRDVVNLKIRYREVTDAGQYAFQSAARVTDWRNIRAVSIFFVLQSAQSVQMPKDQTVMLFDAPHTAVRTGRIVTPFLFTYSIEQQI